jgi:hypothetical protein
MPKKDKLTIREERLLDNLCSGEFDTYKDALIDAGYAESTASDHPSDIIGKPRFQQAYLERMDKHNVTDDRLLKKLSAGLDAQKVISANVVIKKSDGDEMKPADGMTKDFIEVDDWQAQHKFWKDAMELRGHFPKKAQIEHTGEVGIYRAEFARPLKEIAEDE